MTVIYQTTCTRIFSEKIALVFDIDSKTNKCEIRKRLQSLCMSSEVPHVNAADGFGSETKLGPLEGAALLAGRSSFRNAAQRSSYTGLRKVVDGYFPMPAEKGDAQGRTSEPHGAEEESDGTKDKSRQAPRKRHGLMTIFLISTIAGIVFCSVCVCCVCAHLSFSHSDSLREIEDRLEHINFLCLRLKQHDVSIHNP